MWEGALIGGTVKDVPSIARLCLPQIPSDTKHARKRIFGPPFARSNGGAREIRDDLNGNPTGDLLMAAD